MPPLEITAANQDDVINQHTRRIMAAGGPETIELYPAARHPAYATSIIDLTDAVEPIPRHRWKELTAAGQAANLHTLRKGRLPPHNQGPTNYCWAQGSVRTVELRILRATNIARLLSPESVAVPLTGGRNRGGNADEAFPRLVEYGACHADLWPQNSRDPNNWTRDAARSALQHRVQAFGTVKGYDRQMTIIFAGLPLALPLLWWSHLVCGTAAEEMSNGSIGTRIDNSWGADWGDDGSAVLDEEHATAEEEAYFPILTSWDGEQLSIAERLARRIAACQQV